MKWSQVLDRHMAPVSTTVLTLGGVGATILVVGYLIRFREWTFLVAGYDPGAGVDPEYVARVVGNTVIRVGLATLAVGVVAAFGVTSPFVWAAFAVAVAIAVARTVYRVRTGPDRTGA